MKPLLLTLIITAIALLASKPVLAYQDIEQKVIKLEQKVSKKFSKTFCNSTGFGISEEGALKFSLGETEVEFAKNPLIDKVDIENVKQKILDDVADTCYNFNLATSDLDSLKLKSIN